MIKTSAVLCAHGLGDGILMMILASALRKNGAHVDVYHSKSNVLKKLFPSVNWKDFPSKNAFEKTFSSYDSVYIENDNSDKAWHLIGLRQQRKLTNLHFVFPTPCPKAFSKQDYTFDPKIPFATNLSLATQQFCHLDSPSKENDFFLNHPEKHREFKKRIILHPTSQDPKRNWKKKQFLQLADHLKNNNFEPVFVIGPDEYTNWKNVSQMGYKIKSFQDLTKLCEFIYSSGYLIGNDSGLGHIASNCKIPTLTISGNYKRVKLWRPDFFTNRICTPDIPLPNFKGINFLFRENFWQNFVSVRKVLKEFKKLRIICNESL